jgi:hypothetical protein
MLHQLALDWTDPGTAWYFGQVAVFVLLLVNAFYIYGLSRKDITDIQREMYKGFAFFIFFVCLNQLAFLAEATEELISGEDFYPQIIDIGGTGYIWIMIILFAISFVPLMRPIEKYVMGHSRLWIAQLNKVTVVFVVIPWVYGVISQDIVWATYIAYPGLVLAVFSALFSIFGSFIYYLKIGFSSTGQVRSKSLFIGIGMAITYFGVIGGSQIRYDLGVTAGLIGPICLAIGLILTLRGFRMGQN